MKDIKIEILPISMTGQSIFVLRRAGDREHIPTMSLQMPTDVANWLKECAERNQAVQELVQAAQSIEADLSFNADRRGLNDQFCRIESVRVRGLLEALYRLTAH